MTTNSEKCDRVPISIDNGIFEDTNVLVPIFSRQQHCGHIHLTNTESYQCNNKHSNEVPFIAHSPIGRILIVCIAIL